MKHNSGGPEPSTREPPELLSAMHRRGPITLRAVILGLCCVIFIAAYSPYNDFALKNTYFIGNHFPIGITLLMCLFILGLNPLLKWLRPSAALRSSELITIWAMCLVGAAFPTAGLLRQLIPWMVSPFYLVVQHPKWQPVLDMLPAWLFPVKVPSGSLTQAATDPINESLITTFMLGTDEGEPLVVPWRAWLRPLTMWGLYYVPLFIGVLLLSVLMSRQWIVHEKLQYPIATVMLEMVREAPAGRRFNALFTDRRMWLGAGIVIAIHLTNGLHNYFPKVPTIQLGFNLASVFTEGKLAQTIWYMKQGVIYFSMVGIAFLMTTEVSLSLWFFLLLYGMIITLFGYANSWEALRSQNYGAILAMGGYLLFVARTHLWRALRVSFGLVHPQREPIYAGYRWVVWGLFICIITCIVWLCTAGMSLPVAVAQIIIIYLIYLVLSRLVAETGMFFVLPRMWSDHLFTLLVPKLIAARDQALVICTVWPSFYPRETLMPFAFNALRLGHEATETPGAQSNSKPVVQGSFVGALITAMVLSMIVAGAVWLTIYYSSGGVRVDSWTAIVKCTNQCDYMFNYFKGIPPQPGQGPGHMALGAAIVILLGFCRLRFARWPFVPIAFCMATTDALGMMWFSILLGWACKVAVMRVGGVSIYNRCRPMFLGLVIGEILMAGVWMAVGAVVKLNGIETASYRILPG